MFLEDTSIWHIENISLDKLEKDIKIMHCRTILEL